jgi:hypothetical protein
MECLVLGVQKIVRILLCVPGLVFEKEGKHGCEISMWLSPVWEVEKDQKASHVSLVCSSNEKLMQDFDARSWSLDRKL